MSRVDEIRAKLLRILNREAALTGVPIVPVLGGDLRLLLDRLDAAERVVEAARKHRGAYREESPGNCELTDAIREYDQAR